ncbi:hypothetical protein BpHYR1_012868 [Brachionus plicatilis]|uniref:Uncharacterized protein n=1 Tax=Brachionus plicatilis TaxID=10195 RepID=A0A3M7RZI2_BRAPC|nr:hypothetical protein BpHYR1_012868 [Brachionus plicatilis]
MFPDKNKYILTNLIQYKLLSFIYYRKLWEMDEKIENDISLYYLYKISRRSIASSLRSRLCKLFTGWSQSFFSKSWTAPFSFLSYWHGFASLGIGLVIAEDDDKEDDGSFILTFAPPWNLITSVSDFLAILCTSCKLNAANHLLSQPIFRFFICFKETKITSKRDGHYEKKNELIENNFRYLIFNLYF